MSYDTETLAQPGHISYDTESLAKLISSVCVCVCGVGGEGEEEEFVCVFAGWGACICWLVNKLEGNRYILRTSNSTLSEERHRQTERPRETKRETDREKG